MIDLECEGVQREIARVLKKVASKSGRAHDGAVSKAGPSDELWKEIEARGFVECAVGGNGFKISVLGRLFLRRVLSRVPESDAAGRQEPSRCKPAHRPAEKNVGECADSFVDVRSQRESPLGWFVRRKDRLGRPLITREQFDAGERLREDFHKGQMGARVTTNWNAARVDGQGGAQNVDQELMLQDAALRARDRVRRALAVVGPELSGVLVDVCCFELRLSEAERLASLPQRSGKVVLCLALSALARHYGLAGPSAQASLRRAGMMRHWGSDGYRPNIDGMFEETAA